MTNFDYNLPLEYQIKFSENNGNNKNTGSTTSAEENFIDSINERLGSGDKTAIQELETKGIPAIVSETGNGYKVKYTYGRVNYTITYFPPSESNGNIQDETTNDETTNAPAAPTNSTTPEVNPTKPDNNITQNTTTNPPVSTVTPETSVPVQEVEEVQEVTGSEAANGSSGISSNGLVDENAPVMWLQMIGFEDLTILVDPDTGKLVDKNRLEYGSDNSANLFFDMETGEFLPEKAKAWCESGFKVDGYYNVKEIAQGLFEYVDPDGHVTRKVYDPNTQEFYDINSYEISLEDKTTHSGVTIPAGSKSYGWDSVSSNRYLELRGKSEYIDKAMQSYVQSGIIKVEQNSLYQSDGTVNEKYEETVERAVNHFREHYDWFNFTSADIAEFNKCEEIRPGVFGIKGENGESDTIKFYYDASKSVIVKFDDTKSTQEIIEECANNIAFAKRASEDITTSATRKQKWLDQIDSFTQLYLALTGNSELNIYEVQKDITEQNERYGQTSTVDINHVYNGTNGNNQVSYICVGSAKEEQEVVDALQDISNNENSIPWYAGKDYGDMPDSFGNDSVDYNKNQLIAAGVPEENINDEDLEKGTEYLKRRLISDFNFPESAFIEKDGKIYLSAKALTSAQGIDYTKLGVTGDLTKYWDELFKSLGGELDGNSYSLELSSYFKAMYQSCEALNKIYLTSVAAGNVYTGNDVQSILGGDAMTAIRGADFIVFDENLGHNVQKTFESIYAKYQGDNEELFDLFCEAYPEVRVLMHVYGANTISELPILMGGAEESTKIYNYAKQACEYFGNDFYAHFYNMYSNLRPEYGDISKSIRSWAKQYNRTEYLNAESIKDLKWSDFKEFCDYMNGCYGFPRSIINNIDNYFREMGYYDK